MCFLGDNYYTVSNIFRMSTMGKGIHRSINAIAFGLSIMLGSSAFAADPCIHTEKLSGGTVIADTNLVGFKENGYRYELWRESDGGELTLYPQDACFKVSWDNPTAEVFAKVGISSDIVDFDNIEDDFIASYAFQTTGDDGGTYSAIGVEGLMNNNGNEFYIVEDWMNEDSFMISPSNVGKEEYVVDGETYKVIYIYPHVIWSVRQSRRQCGTVNVSEHIRNWINLGIINSGSLQQVALAVEVAGGKGSVDFTYSAIEVIENNNLPEVASFPSDTTVIKPNAMIVTGTSQKSIGNGYAYDFYHDYDNNQEGMIIYGGDDDCAFRAEWHKNNEFLAGTGYLDSSAAKPYGELGEITADYSYTKTGNGMLYSLIGVHGFMMYPYVEYYIVDDIFQPFNFDIMQKTHLEEIGSYEMDGEVYTLYKDHYTMGDLGWGSEIDLLYAIRSSFRTSGHISVSEHFKKWEEMGQELSGIYNCMISCDIYGGTGSIDYSMATMSWDGLEKPKSDPSFVAEHSSSGAILLAPNPAENFFTVMSAQEISSIEILDVLGCSLNIQTDGAKVTFDLPAGTYLVKVTTVSGNTSVQKLMVK